MQDHPESCTPSVQKYLSSKWIKGDVSSHILVLDTYLFIHFDDKYFRTEEVLARGGIYLYIANKGESGWVFFVLYYLLVSHSDYAPLRKTISIDLPLLHKKLNQLLIQYHPGTLTPSAPTWWKYRKTAKTKVSTGACLLLNSLLHQIYRLYIKRAWRFNRKNENRLENPIQIRNICPLILHKK